ncbi:hypothetical protein PHLGIDRAFT_27046 [Phlebiopsis gigantea 11061_1 CR5-6]|uniref:INO80 complex subunit B-like conserved region domain-containing protein n=1 Tax=Phlebiopsis gigantea (strain 11061_1 CR5-6) TaxID=745531 RepID=A0A0C3N9S9_PHLG1|nr:hypothetical protein PHLGIDRAFT_27046 [Phlebiopsis gigantea 11061_1 CR5-6]
MSPSLSVYAITGLSFIALASAHSVKRPPPPEWASPSNHAVLPGQVAIPPAETRSKKKKKAATKGGAQSASQTEVEPTVVAFPGVVPGGFETQPQPAEPAPTAQAAAAASKPKKKKKSKKAAGGGSAVPLDAQSDSSATAPESSSTPVPRPAAKRKSTPVLDDEPWTRVESRRRAAAPQQPAVSDAGITTSVTGTSSPVAERTEDEHALGTDENRRTLAERLLPKPRKTHVEDMLETPDVPSVARVMRVTPRADERPAAGFSWADYEDVDNSGITADDADGEDESGWITKSSRIRSKPSDSTVPTRTTPETLTKKQRQNQKRKELEKSEKAAARVEQEAALARHKRELEKVRMQEQFAKGKKASGGMKASVDAKGHMVFE